MAVGRIAWSTVLLSLTVVAPIAQGQAGRAGLCAVHGIVVTSDSRRPVSRARLTLTALAGNVGDNSAETGSTDETTYRTRSDADGRFCFESTGPGLYELYAERVGFMRPGYRTASPLQRSALVYVGENGYGQDIQIRLIPQGVISGSIATEYGDPVDKGSVQLLSVVWIEGLRRTSLVRGVLPNDIGEYRFGGLSPGVYYVRFQPHPTEGLGSSDFGLDDEAQAAATYYPSALDTTTAAPIVLGAGMHASRIDLVVRPTQTFAVGGKLRLSGAAPAYSSLELLPLGEEPAAIAFGSSLLEADGAFQLPRAPAGVYEIHYLAGSDGGHSVGRTPVTVIDEDVTDLLVDAPPPMRLAGSLVADDTGDRIPDDVRLRLFMAGSMLGPIYDAAISDVGAIVFEGVSAGRYHLRMRSRADVYIESVQYGGAESTTNVIDVRSGGGELLVVLAAGSARIEGSILKSSNAEAPSRPYYAVVPLRRDRIDSDVSLGIADAHGAFTVGGLTPGRHAVFAFEALEADAFRNPSVVKALEPLGVVVDIKAGATVTVAVPSITAVAAEKAVTRARQQAH